MKVRYRHYRFPKNILSSLLYIDVISSAGNVPILASKAYPEGFTGRHGTALHYQRGVTKWKPSPCGGYTTCTVYDDDNNELAIGVAECSPLDSFCYRIGRTIARGRATKALCKFKQMDAAMRKLNSARSQPDWWGAEHDDPTNN